MLERHSDNLQWPLRPPVLRFLIKRFLIEVDAMNLPALPPPSAIVPLPTMHDLPSDHPEDPGLPDEFHSLQPQLLSETLQISGYTPLERFNAFDLNLYYDPAHPQWYKRPDWFLVVGTTRKYRGLCLRSSYVVWDEGIPPVIAIEFLSPGTESEDLGHFAAKPPKPRPNKPPGKFTVYEQILKVPNYIVFDEDSAQLRFFRLYQGGYQEQRISPTNPRLWIPELDLGLALWSGTYRDSYQPWLRWCDRAGHLFPTLEESANAAIATTNEAIAATNIAVTATNAAIAATNEAIAAKNMLIAQNRQAIMNLLASGMPPEQVAAVFGISIDELPPRRKH